MNNADLTAEKVNIYPADWEFDSIVANGSVIHVRPIKNDDKDSLVAFHDQLSIESISLRFFSAKSKLSDREATHFTDVDYVDRMALVGIVNNELVAVSRYDKPPGSRSAEVAFIVRDDLQGIGIGTLLLEHLAAYARELGIEYFYADTLPRNRKMLDVFRSAGFSTSMTLEDGVVRVRFSLAPTKKSRYEMEQRERLSEIRSMEHLFKPKTVAVVGASRKTSSVGHTILRNLLDGDFAGTVFPVNPHADSVCGVHAYKSLCDIPVEIDLVVVVTPSETVQTVIDEAANAKAKVVLIVSAGFAETGRAVLEANLIKHGRERGLRIVGPNCLGVINPSPEIRLNASFSPIPPPYGSVALVSQSGAVGIAVLDAASRFGLGISGFISIGNKADVSSNDVLYYLAEDPATKVIGMYLESFGNPRKFARIAKNISRNTPIVAVKAGRSHSGNRGAKSHTAAIATSDIVVDALFKQAGVIRVEDIEELVDVARILVTTEPISRGNVALVGNSGGPLILGADACESNGLLVPEFSVETVERFKEFAPAEAALFNPVDLTASASAEDIEKAIRVALEDESIDAVMVVVTPLLDLVARRVREILTALFKESSKPILGILLAAGRREPTEERVISPVFSSPSRAAKALSRVLSYGQFKKKTEPTFLEFDDIDFDRAKDIISRVADNGGGWLSQADTQNLLNAFGIDVVKTFSVKEEAELEDVSKLIKYPAVIKVEGKSLIHKSDIGGVALNINSPIELKDKYSEFKDHFQSDLAGVIVQEMVEGSLETIIGLVNDPLFGPLVMFGIGGVTAELLNDASFKFAPLSVEDAQDLADSLRGSPLLYGYRGSIPVDIAATRSILMRVAKLGDEFNEIMELDLNPVILRPDGVFVVDARIRVEQLAPKHDPLLRRLR